MRVEPDNAMASLLKKKIDNGELPPNCRLTHGSILQLPDDQLYDTVIYIDVLEHIADDKENVTAAVQILKENGKHIVLSPAFNFLFNDYFKLLSE